MILFIDTAAGGGGSGGSGSTTVWNSADKTSTVALSNSDLTATLPNDGNNKGVRATSGKTAGKWYWEYEVDSVGGTSQGYRGIKRADANIFLITNLAAGWVADGSVEGSLSVPGSTTSYTVGDVLMFAMDVDAGSVWFGKNGTWQGGGNPAAGTSPTVTGITGAAAWHPWYGSGDGQPEGVTTINCGATAFNYAPPSGFAAI